MVDLVTEYDIEEGFEALVPERDRCAQAVLEFMSACGVRVTTTPPQLIELLTSYGVRAMDIGQKLAHGKRTLPTAPPPAPRPNGLAHTTESGVLSTAAPRRRDPDSAEDPTVEVVLPPRQRAE